MKSPVSCIGKWGNEYAHKDARIGDSLNVTKKALKIALTVARRWAYAEKGLTTA